MLAVYLDGVLVREVPDHISEQRALVLVGEAVAEGDITGTVEVKPLIRPPVIKRRDARSAVQRLPLLR